jgi:ADP-ribosyl-[dinitrogen reductase] hydrolase
MDRKERAIGSILGLAIGDALGAPFEYRRRTQIAFPLPAFELPWMGLPPGTWTDDTAMARNLWLSLVDRRGALDLDDVLRRHLAWLEAGPPDVGNQTRLALSEIAAGTPDPARAVFERRGPEVSAGNGSVMYCAPLGAARALDPDALDGEAPALSRLTHWAALVEGEASDAAVVGGLACVSDREGGEELEFLVAEAGRSRQIDGPDQSFALFTAGVALQVVAEALGFEEGLRRVVGLGGDTDTNAAVSGALLGALHGRDAIPVGWLDRLAERDAIEREAAELAALLDAP